MTGKTKKIIGAVVAIAVIGAVVGFSVNRENRKKTTVQTGKVEKKDLVQVVTASGEVRPRRYVTVGANVSGRLVEINVLEGDRVKKGQVLAKVESERYEAIQRQSEAGVAAARADLQRTEADVAAAKLAFDRAKRMQLALRKLAETDALTGVSNRHRFTEVATAMLQGAGRTGVSVASEVGVVKQPRKRRGELSASMPVKPAISSGSVTPVTVVRLIAACGEDTSMGL